MKSREQDLVDICFQVALMINDKKYRKNFNKMDNEELTEYVRRQLSGCGFETKQVGMSWGVLQ